MSKLLYITTNLQGSGGVSRVLSVKLDYLIEEYGYTIHVITTNNNSDAFFYSFNKNIVFHKIDIADFKFWNLLKYKRMLQNIVEEVKPDIIINCDNGFKGSLLPYFIKTKASLIYEKHGSKQIKTSTVTEKIKNRLSNYIIGKSIKKYSTFVVLNDEDKNDWKEANVKMISNPLWFNLPKKENKLQNKIALAVGRHSVEKQFDVLLEIWKEVVTEYPDWVLKIYGENDKAKKLKKLVRKLDMDNQVELHLPTKDIEQVYSGCSMLLNSSSSEAFGLVIIEAMAYGLPVIAFDRASGPKSLINNDNNGFLINDMDAYANKVKLLIRDKDIRCKLGKNAKKSIGKFNLNIIMKQWHELYRSIE